MSSKLYYHEITNKMTEYLFQNPSRMDQIDEIINSEYQGESSIYSVCAQAANTFGTVEALSDDALIDWDNALDEYAEDVINHLLEGNKIDTLDMISMASQSGLSVR